MEKSTDPNLIASSDLADRRDRSGGIAAGQTCSDRSDLCTGIDSGLNCVLV